MSISDEIGLAFRDQNWGEKQIELRGLLGKTCLMLGSELRGQMVRFAGQRWENHQNRESQRLVRMRPAQGNWSGFEFRFVKTKAGNVSVVGESRESKNSTSVWGHMRSGRAHVMKQIPASSCLPPRPAPAPGG